MKSLKRVLAVALTLAMFAPNCLTAKAATSSQCNLYSQVFDASYYAATYPDVAAACGDNYTALLNHYIDNGLKEGRSASETYNASAYLNNYPDLQQEFGTDFDAATRHYISFGKAEGRTASANGVNFVSLKGSAQSTVPTTTTAVTGGIASCTTYYDPAAARGTNIQLAASKINGTVVAPGAEFSYNNTVGQRTTAAGFVSAPIFVSGRHGTGIGGGICQVSSTLYSACLDAGLSITERHAHSLPVSYVGAGRDATVSWGTKDFKFVNNTGKSITIYASANNGTLTVTIQ